MEKKLQRGNIIKLKKGMSVFINVKEKFIPGCSPFSENLAEYCISIGDILKCHINAIDKQNLFFSINGFLNSGGIYPEYDEIENFIDTIIKDEDETFDTSVYEGEYIVTSAGRLSNGSIWRVKASKMENEKLIPNKFDVTFCQTPNCEASILPKEFDKYDDILSRIINKK